MKKLKLVLITLLFISITSGCSDNNKSIDLDKKTDQTFIISSGEFIEKDQAIDIVKKDIPTALGISKDDIEIINSFEATEVEPYWIIELKDKTTNLEYDYVINGFTGEVLGVSLNDGHSEISEDDETELKKEMEETIVWVFENWQSFNAEAYDPSKYGLAFSLNFRLQYIFDNYEENIKRVKEENIKSEVKTVEVKDVVAVFDEEDHTMYGQMRILAEYNQTINEKNYNEVVEVLIYSKNILEADESWQITNVDVYNVDGNNYDGKLFLGFDKSID